MEIRPYRHGDEDGIFDLILPIQQEEFDIPITREEQTDLDRIPEFYQQNKGNFWVAITDNGRIVGTISLVDIGNGQGALRKMFVASDYRGQPHHTASHLLKTLLDWSRDQGIKTIYLGTTEKFKAAHRFYEKNGFDLIDVETLPETFPLMAVDTRFYRYRL